MAVMSRSKRAIGQSWKATNKKRQEDIQKPQETEEKPITEEEHKARIEQLKKLGLIK